jgi:hypothetical protein
MTRNSELLEQFVRYCSDHPELRFWQALRNWAHVKFVQIVPYTKEERAIDTFHFEGKDH